MKPSLNTIIVGAGGVTSYLLPALLNTFSATITLIDKDELELKNLDRQLFRKSDIGKPKAEALLAVNKVPRSNGNAIVEWMDTPMLDDVYFIERIADADVIIAAVDNHPARKCCFDAAERFGKPILVMANEYSTSQAMFWNPRWDINRLSEADPRLWYPEIETSSAGSPIRCTGEALESTPQLAMANNMSAAMGLHLLWTWFSEEAKFLEDPETFLPIEFRTTFSATQTKLIEHVQED